MGTARNLWFKGFSKLYNGSGNLVANLIVMEGYGEIVESTPAYSRYAFYACNTGSFVCCAQSHKEETADCGIKYIHSYKDKLGQLYYIAPITKNIVVEI